MQFGFQEGVGCTEASFTIIETINHMLERGSKVFSCFLDVRKAFDTVWIDGLLYKLFWNQRYDVAGHKRHTPMSKHKFFTRAHCPEKLMYHRVQDRVAF